MGQKVQRKNTQCHLFFGEWQVVRPACFKLLRGLYPGLSRDQVVMVHGDDVTESSVLELLKTKDLFSTRTIVIYQEPDFLQTERSHADLWKGFEKALLNDNRDRAAKILFRIMGALNISVNELRSGREEVIKRLKPPDGLATSCLELFDGFETSYEHLVDKPEAKAGERLFQWLSRGIGNPRRDVFLCIHIEKPQLKNRMLGLFLDVCPLTDLRVSGGTHGKKTAFLQAQLRGRLQECGKKISPEAVRLFMEKVGDESLSALKNEMDKLLTLAAKKDTITLDDVQGLVARHREEEIFKVSDAVRQKDMKLAIKSARLLMEQGIHPLVVLSAVRNMLSRIFAMKVAMEAVGTGMENVSYNIFRDKYFGDLKGSFAHSKKNPLAGLHPYAAWLTATSVSRFSWQELFDLLEKMADLDFALKGGKISAGLVLESFFLENF